MSDCVSIIIVNWNTEGLLRGCLQSICLETQQAFEIIVIDNASSDGSVAMMETEFPQVQIIANAENRGFAAANNQGLAIAKGDYILLLNPDTVVVDGAIDRMRTWIAERPEIGCAGCQVWEDMDTIQRTCFSDPSPLNLTITTFGLSRLASFLPILGRPWYENWDRCSDREVDVVSGMFMMVPRPVLDAVGPLDEAFFVYAEEADWCRRIRTAGWRCTFTTTARILHLDGGGKSTAQIKPRMHVQMQKSHLIYARKHHGTVGYATVKTVFALAACLRLAIFGLVGLVRFDDGTRARLQLSRASLRYLFSGREPTG